MIASGRSSRGRSRRRSSIGAKPDRGIWEVRGEPQHFTSSKVFCWVACDRGSRLAELRDDSERAKRWREAADEIKADVLEHGLDKRGVFVQHYGSDALDAALLLLPLMRFLRPTTTASGTPCWRSPTS